MKSNKEKIYDFIQMHDTAEKEGGVSTTYMTLSDFMQMKRQTEEYPPHT